MGKPTRSVAQLLELIQARVDESPEVDGLARPVLEGSVVWKDPGAGGTNWTVRSARNPESYSVGLARIIRQVQNEFDLEE